MKHNALCNVSVHIISEYHIECLPWSWYWLGSSQQHYLDSNVGVHCIWVIRSSGMPRGVGTPQVLNRPWGENPEFWEQGRLGVRDNSSFSVLVYSFTPSFSLCHSLGYSSFSLLTLCPMVDKNLFLLPCPTERSFNSVTRPHWKARGGPRKR